ncbi:MAG: hypothetical protein ACJ72H_04445 [Candidatus Sulfotelmatobacter sp.]|jgi:hypothetical protein|nr:MAG: hypothetical protein DMG99_03555 [Acidobacteriota bacterium]
MAQPLRKDEAQFDNEEITTADLAQGKRPANTQEMRPQPATMSGGRAEQADGSTQLFPSNELQDLRTRWKDIQTGFVDEPRKAVEQADGLVASAMKRLAEVFAQERSGLEQQWDRGDNVSTEDLRVALQRYRSFFDRLLSV